MSEKPTHNPEGESQNPTQQEAGQTPPDNGMNKKEEKREGFYSLDELPERIRGLAALYLGRIEVSEYGIKRIQERIDQGEFAESQALLDGKLADIRGSETEIEANRLLLEKCLSKKENLTTKLLPGYEWRDEGKRIQSRVFKDGTKGAYNGRPICEITIQPDPDDPEFGMIVSVNKHEGTSLTYPSSTSFFNQFEDADFGGLNVGVTTKPLKFRLYNKLPPIYVDGSLGSGLAGTEWTQSDRIMCMPTALVDMATSYLNPEDPNDDQKSAELRGGRKRLNLEINYQPDDFGHLKGAEKGEIFTIAAPDSLKSKSDRQDLANRLAKHGYNPADYGLPPAKKEEPRRRPERQPVPEPVKPVTTRPDDSDEPHDFVGDYLFETKPTRPVEPKPPVVVEEVKPRPDVKFVSGEELQRMEIKMILGEMEPNSRRMKELRGEYLKLQKDVADAKAKLKQAEMSRGTLSRFFGTGLGPVREAEQYLRDMQSDLKQFQRMHSLPVPVEDVRSVMAGEGPALGDMMGGHVMGNYKKPGKTGKKGRGGLDEYDGLMGKK